MRHVVMLFTPLSLAVICTAEESADAMRFSATNHSDSPRRTVARVSIPVPEGEIDRAPRAVRVTGPGGDVSAQSAVITRHPDGSVRRLMLSLPVEVAAGDQAQYACRADDRATELSSMLSGQDPARVKTEAFAVLASQGRVQLLDAAGDVAAVVEPFGPDLGSPAGTTLTVLDAGPHYVWLRYNTDGEKWSREIDVEINRFGQVQLTHRLQVHVPGNSWTPDFGFDLTAYGARTADPPSRAVHFMARDYSASFADSPELIVPLTLADGIEICAANPLAIRQNRGALSCEMSAGQVRIRSNRNESVEDLDENGLMIQEGQWRVSWLTIAPVGRDEMAWRLDEPLRTHADWRLYDAVYHTGAPLDVEAPLIRRAVDKYVRAMQGMSISGDDWGNMTSWSPQRDGQAINSQVRYNHCRYVWEEYFRGGDPRLLDIARDWSENYRNLSIYWGPNDDYYGGSRRGRALRDEPGSPHGPGSYMVRFNNAIGWLTKGFAAFWLAYEETGDPRFRDAAEAQARWSADHVTCLRREMRSVGVIADYSKLYEYTGNELHLEQAVRLWEEFRQGQMDNLLFTQHGKEATGDHLYIHSDAYGYQHQFVKPYMVQYAANSLPYLLEHRPDDRHLRDTIVALNDWMATHRQPGGGWGYPHYLTAGMQWNNEYCHGIMVAYELQPKDIYLEAVRENVAPVVQLLEVHAEVPRGLNPWESAAGIDQQQRAERYHLATDRDPMRDYEEGQIKFGQSPDNCVYFAVLLRDYLRCRSEETVLQSYELLEKMKRLPTTLDARSAAPAR